MSSMGRLYWSVVWEVDSARLGGCLLEWPMEEKTGRLPEL